MEFLYYSKHWPGSNRERIFRFLKMFFLELKRLITGKVYIAEFDVTDNCNLKCKHCYHFNFKNRLNFSDLAVEAWSNKFAELKKRGIRRVLLIGGEPALRQDIIAEATKYFSFIDICSNGTIKIGEFYKQKIFVSIDGKREMHDKFRGVGTYEKVLQNYYNDKRVVFSMTVTPMNWEQIEYVIQLAIESKIMGVSCDLYTPSPSDPENDPLYITPEIREKIIIEMYRLKKKYPDYFMMSKSVIKWYQKKDHKNKSCYWKQAVKHYNAQLNERPSCKNLDCGNCGHFAEANLSPLVFLLNK